MDGWQLFCILSKCNDDDDNNNNKLEANSIPKYSVLDQFSNISYTSIAMQPVKL